MGGLQTYGVYAVQTIEDIKQDSHVIPIPMYVLPEQIFDRPDRVRAKNNMPSSGKIQYFDKITIRP